MHKYPFKKNKNVKKTPDWLINPLKGLLLLLLAWNIFQQLPDDFLKKQFANNQQSKIKEIVYNQASSIRPTKSKFYLNWSNLEIPHIDPDLNGSSAYFELPLDALNNLSSLPFDINYKGQVLTPTQVYLLTIQSDSSFTVYQDGASIDSFLVASSTAFMDSQELWISVETVRKKTFFTKLRVESKNNTRRSWNNKEAAFFWDTLIEKDKHKEIDNLTVSKPIFREKKYLFKWGNWERFPYGPKEGRRIKVGINQFKEWSKHQPQLTSAGAFVPFSMSINYWTRRKRGQHCLIYQSEAHLPLVATNECFKEMVDSIEVGDVLSIFLFPEKMNAQNLMLDYFQSFHSFMINGRKIRYNIPIEIVAENFTPSNTPLRLNTSAFNFQLNSSQKGKAIVKMDINNSKNKALKEHYTKSEFAEIISINNFKTVRRVITAADIFVEDSEIGMTLTLMDKVFKTETFPEFYDFNIFPPLIKFRNLSLVLDNTHYNFSQFQQSKKGFEIYIGREKVKIHQLDLTIIPKEGKATKFITNDLDKPSIKEALAEVKPNSSLYFENILIERNNGEQLLFPLTTVLHLK